DRIEAQRQQVLQQASDHATKLINDAHAAAERVCETQTRKALSAAEQILLKAREAALRDHDRMRETLKREAGQLVVQATAAILTKNLSAEDQQRLLMQTVQSFATENSARERRPTPFVGDGVW